MPNSTLGINAELFGGLRCRTPLRDSAPNTLGASVPNLSVGFGAELLCGDWRLPQSTPAFGAESFGA